MTRLVIASRNPGKTREMKAILEAHLAGLPVEVLTLADFPEFPEPDENGDTYAANSEIKARASAEHLGEVCIGDDVGLEIDALDGLPGLHSKRFAGDTPFPEKIAIILDRLAKIPDDQRTTRFRCAVVVCEPGGPSHVFESVREGRIAHAPAGAGGFGYDPIFFLPEFGCTMAELTPGGKNEVSHRALALAAAVPFLRELFS